MMFTWRTYRRAIRRSMALEFWLFDLHQRAYRGPHPWRRQMLHTNALMARADRELRFPWLAKLW